MLCVVITLLPLALIGLIQILRWATSYFRGWVRHVVIEEIRAEKEVWHEYFSSLQRGRSNK